MDLTFIITALLLAGFVAGVVAGLLGVGGGIVSVPVLFHVFLTMGFAEHLQIHMAVGTSLAIICFTSVLSARSHWKKGAVDVGILKSWGLFVAVGALAGAVAARFIVPDILKIIFAGFSLTIGVRMLLSRDGGEGRNIGLSLIAQKILSTIIGFLSALMGIGGGTFNVVLLGMVGRNVHQAVATSSALGFLIAVPATLGFIVGGWNVAATPPYSAGYVYLLALIIMIPTSMLGAPLGARLAHWMSRATLNYVFTAFLFLGAGRILVSLF